MLSCAAWGETSLICPDWNKSTVATKCTRQFSILVNKTERKRDLRSKSGPDGAELDSDDSGADDDHLFRDLGQLESSGRGNDLLLIDFDA